MPRDMFGVSSGSLIILILIINYHCFCRGVVGWILIKISPSNIFSENYFC